MYSFFLSLDRELQTSCTRKVLLRMNIMLVPRGRVEGFDYCRVS